MVHQRGCLLYRVRLWWRLVRQRGVSCTECGFGGVWYTSGVSPVPSVALVAVCTPEGCLLYRVRLWWQLVHQRGVSCTECGFGGSWYTRGVSPVPSAALVAVWYTRGVSPVPSVALVAVGTPEGALRYKSTLKILLAPLKLSKDLC